jgi:hypothetical protein
MGNDTHICQNCEETCFCVNVGPCSHCLENMDDDWYNDSEEEQYCPDPKGMD